MIYDSRDLSTMTRYQLSDIRNRPMKLLWQRNQFDFQAKKYCFIMVVFPYQWSAFYYSSHQEIMNHVRSSSFAGKLVRIPHYTFHGFLLLLLSSSVWHSSYFAAWYPSTYFIDTCRYNQKFSRSPEANCFIDQQFVLKTGNRCLHSDRLPRNPSWVKETAGTAFIFWKERMAL